MDSFSFNNLQAEKANAILKHRKLRRVASLLRIIEVCAVLVLVSRFSMQLPVAVRNSGEYFRDLSLFMNSPRFVFLIGNIIIIALFAQFSAQGNNVVQEPNLYQELIQNTTKNQETVVAEYSRKKQRMKTGEAKISLEKGYRRCEREKRRGVMRRCESESDKGRKKIEGVAVEEVARPEDGMSNEEFRRTVEAFIAREQRIRREEDYYLL